MRKPELQSAAADGSICHRSIQETIRVKLTVKQSYRANSSRNSKFYKLLPSWLMGLNGQLDSMMQEDWTGLDHYSLSSLASCFFRSSHHLVLTTMKSSWHAFGVKGRLINSDNRTRPWLTRAHASIVSNDPLRHSIECWNNEPEIIGLSWAPRGGRRRFKGSSSSFFW